MGPAWLLHASDCKLSYIAALLLLNQASHILVNSRSSLRMHARLLRQCFPWEPATRKQLRYRSPCRHLRGALTATCLVVSVALPCYRLRSPNPKTAPVGCAMYVYVCQVCKFAACSSMHVKITVPHACRCACIYTTTYLVVHTYTGDQAKRSLNIDCKCPRSAVRHRFFSRWIPSESVDVRNPPEIHLQRQAAAA